MSCGTFTKKLVWGGLSLPWVGPSLYSLYPCWLLSGLTDCGTFVCRAYLEVHQLELEKLSTQIRESKRNSRLVSEGHGTLV